MFVENKIGYLDPEGKLHACASCEHMRIAHEIVSELGLLKPGMTGLDAENALLDLGWVCVRSRYVYGRMGFQDKDKRIIRLSDVQKAWLIAEYDNFVPAKQRAIDVILKNG